MKKFILVSVAFALAMVGCKNEPKEFKLDGSGFPETLNGTYAVIFNRDYSPVDSVLIEDGVFKYVVPANDTVFNILKIDNSMALFAREAGDFTITYGEVDADGNPLLVRGGDANSSFMKYQEMEDKAEALRNTASKEIEDIMAKADTVTGPNAEEMVQITAIQTKYMEDNKALYLGYLNKGGNTLVDWSSFISLANSFTPTEFVEYYESAGEVIKNDKQLADMYPVMQAAARTDVGSDFVDYEITNPAGETKKLSDYRAEGKYFLLDFFASWCGPCQASMPIVADIEKEFASILTSVSIAVWEGDSDGTAYAKAVKDFKITWPTFQDSKSEGTKVYGVSGVPTFILFSPEGTIIARGYDIKAIQAKLRELNK